MPHAYPALLPAPPAREAATSPRIAIVVPYKEKLRASFAGAVALSVVDFVQSSRLQRSATVFGANACDLDIPYEQVTDWQCWYRPRRRAYARAIAARVAGHDLVEVHNRPQLALFIKRACPQAAVVLYLHNDPLDMDGSRSPADRRDLSRALDAIVTVSYFVHDQFCAGLPRLPNVHVLHLGLACPASGDGLRQNLVFFAGRLVRDKGIATLLEAHDLYAPCLPEWRLVVAGPDLMGLFKSGKAPKGVHYLGPVAHAETLGWMQRAAMVVMPTLTEEPFGRVALEALATGTPLITSGTGGLREIVGDTADIVRPDAHALARAIVSLAGDPARRERMGRMGRERVCRLFDVKVQSSRLDDIREQALKCSVRRTRA